MPFFSSPVDSANLFYRYYAPGKDEGLSFRPVKRKTSDTALVLLHGWPISSRMFEHLIVPLCETYRFRVLAPDRRGSGKSDWNSKQTAKPITYDTFVADPVGLLSHIVIKNIVFVGASMGAAESVLTYFGSSFVQERCKGFVWIGPAMPYPLSSPEHPLGPSAELWARYSTFVHDSLPGIFALQADNQVSTKTLENFDHIIAEADGIALEKTCTLINQKTMDKELRELAAVAEARRPAVMILHGDADQGMPLEASSKIVKEMIPWTELKVYERAGHGLYLTHASQVIADLVGFVDKLH
ncbi:alpha/beta-hydrolase [Coniochaeta ligniaria NRRL 30616]|uniref:Alpha/beta-hydrolase n=1 Tax=Coniochaeta ligniaria NRRL 30616 TaxID=1408157 RepID=A0A1J7JF84_9PEZI|nr:alpha/beta-hydrolase [Coniochaeta ligniaria NRRL 30616]